MFKRTVECLFIIALLAGLLAGGAGATMYYYNIPDVRNLPKLNAKGPEGQEVHHRDHLGGGRGADAHTDRKVPGNGTFRTVIVAEPRISRSR